MPIIIPKDLPAYANLNKEKIFVMDEKRAGTQDIRPIEIAVLNLMPTKIETETQLLRLLSNSPLQIRVTFVSTATYTPTHTPHDHMQRFYSSIDEICRRKFDGMIVTGAPVETLEFEDVAYWDEMVRIMDFADKNVTSTIYICWGAQAALYHHNGIGKNTIAGGKLSGVFKTKACQQNDMLLKGMDDIFMIPHSRYTEANQAAIRACKDLKVLADSSEAGIAIVKTHDNKRFFLTGHSEYDRDTLKREYERDIAKGIDIAPPVNYFSSDQKKVNMSWKSTANLLYYNWLNYYVYQVTPYSWE